MSREDRLAEGKERAHPSDGVPEPTDYWGEAQEAACCVDVEVEIRWWEVCGEAYAKRTLAA